MGNKQAADDGYAWFLLNLAGIAHIAGQPGLAKNLIKDFCEVSEIKCDVDAGEADLLKLGREFREKISNRLP